MSTILLPASKEPKTFELHLLDIMKHLMHGEIKKGKSFGIHFFQPLHHRVSTIIHPANEKGVWEALIEIRNPKTNAWVKKKRSSTLFPIHWSEKMLESKLEEAFRNSVHNASFKRTGITSCGIQIKFIFQQNKITSCYPVYE